MSDWRDCAHCDPQDIVALPAALWAVDGHLNPRWSGAVLNASAQSSQLAHPGDCRAGGDSCARRTARSFGSNTEIVSRASLQSRRSEKGRRVVVHGCWTSSVRC